MDFEKERREALAAGRDALSSLENARQMLSSARGWGIFDIVSKGGLISGLIKHSKMNEAEACINRAQSDLARFNDELQDLNLMGINLNTGDLLGFADIIFDGFLTDMLMQNRIVEASNQVDNAIYRVRSLISQLENLQY